MSRRLVMAVPMPTMVHAWMMAAMRCPSAAAHPKMMSHTTLAAWQNGAASVRPMFVLALAVTLALDLALAGAE